MGATPGYDDGMQAFRAIDGVTHSDPDYDLACDNARDFAAARLSAGDLDPRDNDADRHNR